MTEYVCHSCRDEFEIKDMCDHFDDPGVLSAVMTFTE